MFIYQGIISDILLEPNFNYMKNYLKSVLIVLVVSVCFTGCIDIIEDLVLRKDGSGKYTLTMDMSKMMSDPMLKGMMEADEKNEVKDMDSIVYFKDLPDSVTKDNPDLWSRVSMRIVNNSAKESFFVKINLDFKDVSEIGYLSANLNKVMDATMSNPLAGDQPSQGGPSGLIDEGLSYVLNGKELVRTSKPPNEDVSNEDLDMLKNFMGDAEYRMNFELPGKVRKVTLPNAKVEGKKVVVVVPFLQMMEKKTDLGGSIRFK